MIRLDRICRHPVKGFTPETLPKTTLARGAGVPFDRACGFTSGNLADPPIAGGWVAARTFLQLTVYPQLANFTAHLDEPARTVSLTAPNGRSATFSLDDPATAEAANTIIRDHFDPGPHGIPTLHFQAPGHGHWDFTDSGVSIINLATVRWLEQATGTAIDPLRFRGNLLIDGLEPWHEFDLIGHRLKIGDAELATLRPIQRCAATMVDPATGDTSINVPALLRKMTGHLFCGIYARVAQGGSISADDPVADLGEVEANPSDQLPERAPPPNTWPRFVATRHEHDVVQLESTHHHWPLPAVKPGDKVSVHPPGNGKSGALRLKVTAAWPGKITVTDHPDLPAFASRFRLLATCTSGENQ